MQSEKSELNFLNPKFAEVKTRFPILPNGRIGISKTLLEYLNLKPGDYVKFGIDSLTQDLFMVKSVKGDDLALKIVRSGNYYYIAMKGIFKLLEIDYEKRGYFEVRKNHDSIHDGIKLEYKSPVIKKDISAYTYKKKKGN